MAPSTKHTPLSGSVSSVNKPQDKYWYIHGKAYDLSEFVERHPGGKFVLLNTQGKNVTELFESSHSLSSIDVKKMLQKYEVSHVPAVDCPFTFEEGGVYDELKTKVKELFAARKNPSHHWNFNFFLRIACMLALYTSMFYVAFVRGSLLAAAFVGSWWMMVMFCLGHDASHFAITKSETVNKWCMYIVTHWGLWNGSIWFQHHCYGHHSYTGIAQKDPDLRNGSALLRKHPFFPWKSIHQYQHFFMLFLYLLLPNQYIGQVIEYLKARRRGKIFGVPLVNNAQEPLVDMIGCRCVEAASIFCHFILPFLFHSPLSAVALIWVYFTCVGCCYYAIVAPNHDTHVTDKDDTPEKIDWGEQQIRHSSNFSHDNPVLTALFGGMNYQIEHHLFPTVCHVHYPEISKIVKEVCQRRGLQYNLLPGLLSAHFSVIRNYYHLGKEKSE